MVKKKNVTATGSSTTGGAAAKSSSTLSRKSPSDAPPAAPAPPGSLAKLGDWLASSITKRDEKRARSLGLVSPDEGNVILPDPEDECDNPIDSEAAHANLPSSADDACNTVRDDDADHDAFIDAAVEEARSSPAKRSTCGFADEDDLFDIDEGFVEPPAKKAKPGATPPDIAASEASDLRGVISSLEAFASQFTSLEAEKVRLQKEVKSSSSKLDGAVKIAAEARQEVDSLKEELGKLKEKLREEEATRLAAEARTAEKDELLRQSSLALLEAANIPADALDQIPNNSPFNGLSMTLSSHQLTRELLEKGKGAMARIHSMIFPKISQDKTLGQLIDAFAIDTKEVIEVFPVPAFVEDSSGALSEDDRIQRMKDRITQLEKDLRSTYALAAIIKKKGEIAADVERYALTELHKATESLNFISLNRAEENKRIHERVHALTQLSSAEEIFWREQSKASAVAQFQDRVQQVHHFFDKCYKALRVVWRTMFPLNRVPPTLLTLMSEFGNTKKIRDLVRAQVFAGARFTLALVLARYPSANLLSIANATGDLETLYPKVLLPANMIVDKLEKDSKAPEEKDTPQG
ncbi:hypothetical protein QYE76_022643 [Lolium multiflorum]|uniref:Uncharacterized protein n=1 Tax=Lolium multiflorum TaxID=4521 RepID=A0AAD8RAP2_LOLMU|nr:hypothetical protein QYE76_022643 [Lolium multiflorum]